MNVFVSRRAGVERRGRIGIAAWGGGAGLALVVGLALCVPVAGCSLGGKSGKKVPGDEELLVDPCEPACCCRTKDNYYVRYSCSSRVQCMQDGGECATEHLGKCQSADDKTSTTEAGEPGTP